MSTAFFPSVANSTVKPRRCNIREATIWLTALSSTSSRRAAEWFAAGTGAISGALLCRVRSLKFLARCRWRDAFGERVARDERVNASRILRVGPNSAKSLEHERWTHGTDKIGGEAGGG